MKKTTPSHARQLNVTLGGQQVGVLALGQDKKIWFEYAPHWVATGFNLAPKTMAWEARAQLARGDVFGGLHGAFSDSLPDGWGLLLMDREFKRRFDWQPHDITPIDRLAYIGSRAMGHLNTLRPRRKSPSPMQWIWVSLRRRQTPFCRARRAMCSSSSGFKGAPQVVPGPR